MTDRPTSSNMRDDELLAVMWAQIEHGRGLTQTQMAHVYSMGLTEGHARRRMGIRAALLPGARRRRDDARATRGWPSTTATGTRSEWDGYRAAMEVATGDPRDVIDRYMDGVHLLASEPQGQRVAVCGTVEFSDRGDRLNFTIDDGDVTCPFCTWPK